MINVLSRKSALSYPMVLIIGCIALICLYAWSLQHDIFINSRNYALWSIQLFVDALLGFYGYMAYKSRLDPASKKFYLLILISLIPGIFANEIYNFFVQIPSLRNASLDIKIRIRLYSALAHLLFLYIQFAAWYHLFSMSKKNSDSPQSWIAIYPHLSSALMICAAFFFIIFSVHPEVIELKILNSVLEIAVFALISICLSRTRDGYLNYLEIGFLLAIGLSLAHLFADRSSNYFRLFDIVWTCCLIPIVYGLRTASKTGKEKIQFYEKNSIHVYVTGAFILIANVVLILFTMIASGLSILQGNYLVAIPAALIFAFLTTLLLAKFFADRLSRPLDSIVNRIEDLRKNGDARYGDNGTSSQYQMYEAHILERFIIKTIAELHHANRVKSVFLMNMSHDFRTPASGILHMSRLIHGKITDKSLQRLQKLVVNSSEQLMTYLEDVLDYSSLENDRHRIRETEFDMVALIDEMILLMSTKSHENNIVVRTHYAADLILYKGARDDIRKMILNIFSNAIKFTHDGTIEISLSMIHENNQRWLLIKIADTGIGIEQSHHQFIFEPFYRVEMADSARFGGLGLGLSTASIQAKTMGGRISLESEVGKGSVFGIYLPVAEG